MEIFEDYVEISWSTEACPTFAVISDGVTDFQRSNRRNMRFLNHFRT